MHDSSTFTPDRVRLMTRSNLLSLFAEIARGADGDTYEGGVSELSRLVGIDRRGAQRALDDMKAWGLVTLSGAGPGRSSATKITITAKGRAFRAECLATLFPEYQR